MKQHITKEQWDELSNDKKILYLNFSGRTEEYMNIRNRVMNKDGLDEMFYPNIGKMIEFLGDDLEKIEIGVVRGYGIFMKDGHDLFAIELCDVLWEACVYKLKNYGIGRDK